MDMCKQSPRLCGQSNTHTHTHLLVGGDGDEQDDAAGSEAQRNRVDHDLQHHGGGQQDHVVDHQVDVEHIPAGVRGSTHGQKRGADQIKPGGTRQKVPADLSGRPSASPGVLLERRALEEGVDERPVDAVDDESQSEGDDVFGEGLAPAVQTTRRVHDRPPTEAAGLRVSAGKASVKLDLHDRVRQSHGPRKA